MKLCGLTISCLASASAFSSPSVRHHRVTPLRAAPVDNELSRSAFISSTFSAALSSLLLPSASVAEETQLENQPSAEATQPEAKPSAEENQPEKKPSRSIQACEVDADDCVATANIKDAKGTYSPPWTFEVSPDEAFARIKGVLKSDEGFIITEVDDEERYIRAYAKRLSVDQDEVEFLVKGDDKVVLFKSRARKNGSVSDFGANGKRIDDIRRRGAVFGLMGGGMTADSYGGGGAATKGNSPLGQLKAFYGLQKGQGFESVLEE